MINNCLFYCWWAENKIAITLCKSTKGSGHTWSSDLAKNSSKPVIFRSITPSFKGPLLWGTCEPEASPLLGMHPYPCRVRLVLKKESNSELEHELESLTKPTPHAKLFRFISPLSFATPHIHALQHSHSSMLKCMDEHLRECSVSSEVEMLALLKQFVCNWSGVNINPGFKGNINEHCHTGPSVPLLILAGC